MQRSLIGTWGFVVAGAVFLLAAIAPVLAGGSFRAAFFVVAIALLVLGAGVVRRARAGAAPKRER